MTKEAWSSVALFRILVLQGPPCNHAVTHFVEQQSSPGRLLGSSLRGAPLDAGILRRPVLNVSRSLRAFFPFVCGSLDR